MFHRIYRQKQAYYECLKPMKSGKRLIPCCDLKNLNLQISIRKVKIALPRKKMQMQFGETDTLNFQTKVMILYR